MWEKNNGLMLFNNDNNLYYIFKDFIMEYYLQSYLDTF